jgi:hypothetical protein
MCVIPTDGFPDGALPRVIAMLAGLPADTLTGLTYAVTGGIELSPRSPIYIGILVDHGGYRHTISRPESTLYISHQILSAGDGLAGRIEREIPIIVQLASGHFPRPPPREFLPSSDDDSDYLEYARPQKEDSSDSPPFGGFGG